MNEQLKREELRKMIEANPESVVGMKCRGFRFDIPQEWEDGRMGKFNGKEGVIWMLSYQSFFLIKFEDEFYPYPINEIHKHIVLEDVSEKTEFPKDDFGVIVQDNAKEIIDFLVSKGFSNWNGKGGAGINGSLYYIKKGENYIDYSASGNIATSQTFTLSGLKELDKVKIFTCKDLSDGRVACKHDDSVENLEKVARYCFPNDSINFMKIEDSKYLTKFQGNNYECLLTDMIPTDLPTQSVKVFLKEIEEQEKPKEIKVGDYIRGFKFEEGLNVSYSKEMDKFIGQIGVFEKLSKLVPNNIGIRFTNENRLWYYPKDQAIKHLVNPIFVKPPKDFKFHELVVKRTDTKIDKETAIEIEKAINDESLKENTWHKPDLRHLEPKQFKQTYGQMICRVMASNDNSTPTEKVKNMCADLIDLLECLKNDEKSLTYEKSEGQMRAMSGNKLRLLTKAQEEIESGLEWALKGITE